MKKQSQPAPQARRLSPSEEQLAQIIAGIARRSRRPIAVRQTPVQP
jgi:hypothetical protein